VLAVSAGHQAASTKVLTTLLASHLATLLLPGVSRGKGRPYIILGACNPPFAEQALHAELDLGLLLPCNVVVYEQNGGSVVEAMDPLPVLGMVDNPALEPIAKEVRQRLETAIDNVAADPSRACSRILRPGPPDLPTAVEARR
jgi:hypothetical protein